LIVGEHVKKSPAFYGNRTSTAKFIRDLHCGQQIILSHMHPVKIFRNSILMFVPIPKALLQHVSQVAVLPPLHFSPLKFLTNF